ncbi:MAG: IS66 family transposase [Chloroflexi bacterium]|nr:IS66 family transposase [Chloroflexota bacterium]
MEVDLEKDSPDKLREAVRLLLERTQVLEAHVEELETENERLRRENERLGGGDGKKKPPSWTKENRSKKEKKERKKREKGFARQRDKVTKQVKHAYAECPECGTPLSGGRERSRRTVITLPRIRVQVAEHVMVERKCPQCRKAFTPKAEMEQVAVGQQRVGISVQSEVVMLREGCRMPFELIQRYLEQHCGLHLGVGELVALAQGFAKRGKKQCEVLRDQIRGSPVVHGDETGWRENGQNGYLWSFSTPQVRYFLYRKSRGKTVVSEVLGKEFEGVLVSDFYASYNVHQGDHQRCWVHFLRDIHDLKEANPKDETVEGWADSMRKVYDRAKAYAGPAPDLPAVQQKAERRKQQLQFEQELWKLCEPHVRKGLPMSTLCQRVEKFLPEMFMFVADPRVPADNNPAERSLRGQVISRKISGGTRSDKGSETKSISASLFGTWFLQGRDLYQACHEVLTTPLPTPEPTI